MAEQGYPFNAGAGFTVSEDQWRDYARNFFKSGVVGSRFTSDGGVPAPARVTAGTGNQIIRAAAPLGAMVDGMFWRDTASMAVTVPTNVSTNPRVDRTVLRLDPTANTVTTTVITGTPAASPTPPALTQDSVGVWDLPLYRHTMPGSASAQNPSTFIDERRWTIPQYGILRGYGTGAPVNPGTFFSEVSPITVPAFVGELIRVSYSASIRVDGTSVQAINWGVITTGLQAVNTVPTNHFRNAIGNSSGIDHRDTYDYSWLLLATTSMPTVGIQLGCGTGPNRIVLESTWYEIEIL